MPSGWLGCCGSGSCPRCGCPRRLRKRPGPVRAREDVRTDLMRARRRLSKLLLRQAWSGWEATAWTGSHEQWLRGEHFDRRGVQLAFDEALDAVFTIGARRDRLNTAIVEMAETEPLAGPVGRLRCLRGVSTMTAVGLRVEIADWQRFTGATIGAYLGLVPCECSSGDRRVQGGITKTGNTHARWLLVEAAWRHRRPLRTSRASPFVPWRTSCCSTHREDPRGIPRNLRVAARARRAHARARAGGQPTSASPG